MIVNTIPIIETISANPINGNLPSISGDSKAIGVGSKLIKRAINITPAEKDHPNNNINL